MEGEDIFLASRIVPSALKVVEPNARPPSFEEWGDNAALLGAPPVHAGNHYSNAYCNHYCNGPSESSMGCLCAASELFARWFSVMKAAIGRERERQRAFRESNGLPKNAKLPYEQPRLTEAESAACSFAEAVVRALFGDQTADYARDKFLSAIATGDMRAFKIRLLFLKARDSISDKKFKNDFSNEMDAFIEDAENMAGCSPDASPRRMSKSEQARKKRIDEFRIEKAKRDNAQMELPLVWPEGEKLERDNKNVSELVVSRNQTICKKTTESEDEPDVIDKETGYSNGLIQDIEPGDEACSVVRKTRTYHTVDEIMEDMESGEITPYMSQEEIMDDVASGTLTKAEAILFIAALDRYLPEDESCLYDKLNDEKDVDDEDGDLSEEDDEDEELDDDEDDEDRYDSDRESRRGDWSTGISYNPNGFGGVGGCRDGDDEW